MKVRMMGTILAAAVLFSACGKDDTAKKEETVKQEKKESKADIARKKIKENREKKEASEKQTTDSETNETETEEAVTEESIETNEEATTESPQEVNVINITNRNELSQIIYSNEYTVEEKMQAYESGVEKGIIPQGTDESSPAAAYESAIQSE